MTTTARRRTPQVPPSSRPPPPTRPAVCQWSLRRAPPLHRCSRTYQTQGSKLPGLRSDSSSPRRGASSSSTSRPNSTRSTPPRSSPSVSPACTRSRCPAAACASPTSVSRPNERRAVANDQVAIVWPTPELRAQAVSIDGSVAVPEPAVDAVSWSPSTNQMYLWTEQDDGAVATELSVRDLELRWQAASWLDPTDGASPLIDLDGTLLRRDTGGVYRVGSASTDLLTTGDLVSTGANHLLLRECDATRLCTLLTVDRTGERRAWPLNLPPDVRPQLVGGTLSGRRCPAVQPPTRRCRRRIRSRRAGARRRNFSKLAGNHLARS